jgi:transposase InsO family protein
MPRRNTQETLIAMKKEILDSCIAKKIKCLEGAKLLNMHPKSFSRLKREYIEKGEEILTPKPPGPKNGYIAKNRTPEWLENIVCELARNHANDGTIELSEILFEEYKIRLDQSTIYRILKRKFIRYGLEYVKLEKAKPQLYCLETPGEELQLDACYPFGRGRQICCFDAIDDCSRLVIARMYDRETADNAIDFIRYLIEHAPFKIKRIRIDNRSKNKIKAFCETVGIEVIVNDAHTPKQNGKIERFHKTIKKKFFWKYCSIHDDINLINYNLQLWLVYYNEKRRHGGYGMNKLTPIQKLTGSLFNSLYIIPVEKVTLTMQRYKIGVNLNNLV